MALDLGSTTGYAYANTEIPPHCGSITWAKDVELKAEKRKRMDRRCDIRVERFFHWLCKGFSNFDHILFEDVQFSSSTAQTQLWSSFRTAVWLAFAPAKIECVPTGTLKKFATGNGAADKESMAYHLIQRHPGIYHEEMDDNAVDAAWLFIWAKQNLGRVK